MHRRFLIVLLLVTAACQSGDGGSSPTPADGPSTSTTPAPIAAESTGGRATTEPPSPSTTVAPATVGSTGGDPTPDGPTPSLILFNGQVVTMDDAVGQAQALAVLGERIMAVGDDADILDLAGPETTLVDLDGRALLPGFVDTHTHPFGSGGAVSPESLEAGQSWLLAHGTTSFGETSVGPQRLDEVYAAIESTELRVRTSLYLTHNTKCAGLEPDGWMLDHPPDHGPDEMLRVVGVKIFGDAAGVRPRESCGWAAMSGPLPDALVEAVGSGPNGDLLLDAEEMAQAIRRYQAEGYQVIVHARGDVVVDTVLDAIEIALAGQANTYRHRVEHVDFVRPDQLARFGEIGALPTVRGRPSACTMNAFEGNHWLGADFNTWYLPTRPLIDANPGLPVSWQSDRGNSIGVPIHDLYGYVTQREIAGDGSVCEPPEWMAAHSITVEEGLRLMTINAAYALFMEDAVGSLEPGKFADLIVLSENPLTVEPDQIIGIAVLMTMVGGIVEHCTAGAEALCP